MIANWEQEDHDVESFMSENREAFSPIDLRAVRVFMKKSRCVSGPRKTVTTKARVQVWIEVRFGIKLSLENIAELLNGLGFYWGHLRPGYYESHKRLPHVVAHKEKFLPWLDAMLSMPDRFVVVSVDMSFVHALTVNRMGYVDVTDPNGDSDRAERHGTGGPTVGYAAALTRHGVLRDANRKPVVVTVDKRKAGTRRRGAIASFDADAAEEFMQRVRDAVHFHYPHHFAVIILDNNSAHTKLPAATAITPSLINLKATGKKHSKTTIIGKMGLRAILQRLGHWTKGTIVKEARELLWHWSVVVDQLTAIEAAVAKDDLQMVIYNVKYHPEFNAIEKLWRYCKVPLHQHRLNDINAVRSALAVRLCIVIFAHYYFR
jgi:hypothetical protein